MESKSGFSALGESGKISQECEYTLDIYSNTVQWEISKGYIFRKVCSNVLRKNIRRLIFGKLGWIIDLLSNGVKVLSI